MNSICEPLLPSFQMTLIGNINWDGLVAVHRVMAQVLVGTYFALAGVVCMNLYIALLSDTFSRVYARALANAVMQQAHIILSIEKSLSKEKRIRFGHYFKNECGPLVGCSSCIQKQRLNYYTAQPIFTYFQRQGSFLNRFLSMISDIFSHFSCTRGGYRPSYGTYGRR